MKMLEIIGEIRRIGIILGVVVVWMMVIRALALYIQYQELLIQAWQVH